MCCASTLLLIFFLNGMCAGNVIYLLSFFSAEEKE